MFHKNELPQKCRQCEKSTGPIIHNKCNFCRKLEFHESVLCDLNRSIQDRDDFKCHAFQPILGLACPSINRGSNLSANLKWRPKRERLRRLLNLDKLKYERALVLQKLARNPEDIIVELKYHFFWNVIQRRSLFFPVNHYFNSIYDTFLKCGELVGGFVSLLFLAPDHVHLYVESGDKYSVEELVQKMKRFSKDAILAIFLNIRDKVDPGIGIWDEAYFVETVG